MRVDHDHWRAMTKLIFFSGAFKIAGGRHYLIRFKKFISEPEEELDSEQEEEDKSSIASVSFARSSSQRSRPRC